MLLSNTLDDLLRKQSSIQTSFTNLTLLRYNTLEIFQSTFYPLRYIDLFKQQFGLIKPCGFKCLSTKQLSYYWVTAVLILLEDQL